jgi:hypothetical protein
MGVLLSDGSSKASITRQVSMSVGDSEAGDTSTVMLGKDDLYRIDTTFHRRTKANLNELIGFYNTEATLEFLFIHAVDSSVYICKFVAPPRSAYIAYENYTVSVSMIGRKV